MSLLLATRQYSLGERSVLQKVPAYTSQPENTQNVDCHRKALSILKTYSDNTSSISFLLRVIKVSSTIFYQHVGVSSILAGWGGGGNARGKPACMEYLRFYTSNSYSRNMQV